MQLYIRCNLVKTMGETRVSLAVHVKLWGWVVSQMWQICVFRKHNHRDDWYRAGGHLQVPWLVGQVEGPNIKWWLNSKASTGKSGIQGLPVQAYLCRWSTGSTDNTWRAWHTCTAWWVSSGDTTGLKNHRKSEKPSQQSFWRIIRTVRIECEGFPWITTQKVHCRGRS